jgi:hypothetical protein
MSRPGVKPLPGWLKEKEIMKIWNTFAVALVLAAAPASASYITGSINSGADGSVCGAVNEPFLICPAYNGPVSLDIGNARVQTDFGLNKVGVNGANQANSEWMVLYGLTGGAIGTPVNFDVEIAFDLTILVGNNNESEFRMVLNNNTLFPFIIRMATDGLGNRCDHLVGNPAACTTGDHMGIWTQNVTAQVGSNNRMYLNVGAFTNGGLVDAYDTVRINRIIVPDGIGWTYSDGVTGNPLNFQYAATNAVPEPSSFALFACGIALQAFYRLRKR